MSKINSLESQQGILPVKRKDLNNHVFDVRCRGFKRITAVPSTLSS